MEEINLTLDMAKEAMEKAVEHTERELGKIRAGKAHPAMLAGIKIDYYGSLSPLDQVANISTPDARTLVIKPWEKNLVGEIERTLINSDLGLNPQSDGEMIRLNLPALTEERRKDLVKQSKAEAENGKVRIRNARKDSNSELKKLQKDGASEDQIKDAEASVQELTDQFTKKIEDLLAKKESDILTI